MTTTLEDVVTQPGASRTKSRRGTETRKRTARVLLSLLPAQAKVAGVIADQYDKSSIQAMLIDACGPLMSDETLSALAADRAHVQAVAEERGISEVQALLLLALTTRPGADRMAG